MNENEFAGMWTAIEPAAGQRQRMDARVRAWIDARQSSLADEWLEFLKVRPIAGLGFLAVAACLVLIATPLSWAYSLL